MSRWDWACPASSASTPPLPSGVVGRSFLVPSVKTWCAGAGHAARARETPCGHAGLVPARTREGQRSSRGRPHSVRLLFSVECCAVGCSPEPHLPGRGKTLPSRNRFWGCTCPTAAVSCLHPAPRIGQGTFLASPGSPTGPTRQGGEWACEVRSSVFWTQHTYPSEQERPEGPGAWRGCGP